ncbi:hypothetical protein Acr_27g0007420 [Actinidia rufa]|uniref:Uncharacterized protein n=1 Tax=Actinidia rufa TaxID=165716 RepID=A0A7J0H7C0_9ERIC|nr:hypothetical protein Acr_27g0007420 [Actinidia rufa]
MEDDGGGGRGLKLRPSDFDLTSMAFYMVILGRIHEEYDLGGSMLRNQMIQADLYQFSVIDFGTSSVSDLST